jgi:hypothetical protein
MTEERWLPVIGYEGAYEVSDMGRVKRAEGSAQRRNAKPGRLLAPVPNKDGYLQVCLSIGGVHVMRRMHRLVAEAFLGRQPVQMQVNHINGKRGDNRVANLEWCTCKDNIQHAWRSGRCHYGEAHHGSKITNQTAAEIKRMLASGEAVASVASHYGLGRSLVHHIAAGRAWTTVPAAEGQL